MNRRRFVQLTAALGAPAILRGAAEPDSLFETMRKQHAVPAVAGAIVTVDGIRDSGCAGVRKAGGATPVTTTDLWHLGSMTKAMTATLLGTFVQQGRLKWEASLGDLLPDLLTKATPEAKRITLWQLLTHRSGLPANRGQWGAMPLAGSRAEIVRAECAKPLLSEPGSTFLYSNVGYMTAGVIAERLGGSLWEEQITKRVFEPLKMEAGFGGTGTPGKEDQPWPHNKEGKPMPNNGPAMDNPPSLGPAGTCHARLAEYAKFAADHLRGAAGGKALQTPALYRELHEPVPSCGYAGGWHVAERPWADGKVLTHAGSNTMNYFVAWLAPAKGFGVIAACNQGGEHAAAACDGVCSALIAQYRKSL